jgi:hypothetical protein
MLMLRSLLLLLDKCEPVSFFINLRLLGYAKSALLSKSGCSVRLEI